VTITITNSSVYAWKRTDERKTIPALHSIADIQLIIIIAMMQRLVRHIVSAPQDKRTGNRMNK